MNGLLDPLTLRGVTLRNRIGVSPMCQYSSHDGFANDWHLVHLGSRAVGGAGLVMVEASAVEDVGRISPEDMGIWSDAHVAPLARIAAFLEMHGTVSAVQLAHAGRKASTSRPWEGDGPVSDEAGGWTPIAPSAIPFKDGWRVPEAMSEERIAAVLASFRAAARRAKEAGFRWVELHAAHGYLAHEFLSPLSNRRTDRWGGSFENRVRFTLEALRAVRAEWPEELPVSVRLSCTDWVEGGWTLDESVALAKLLKENGADLVDCSSGGNAVVPIPAAAGYQVPFAARLRHEAGIATAAVGFITEPMQADQIVRNGDADVVLLAREELRDPYWPLRAARVLGHPEKVTVPVQYERAYPKR